MEIKSVKVFIDKDTYQPMITGTFLVAVDADADSRTKEDEEAYATILGKQFLEEIKKQSKGRR